MRLRTKNKGFSLIEIVVAIGIIISVFIGSIILISFSISNTKVNKSRIIAIGLAQEGLEIVRNIRDNNWLAGLRDAGSWREGLGEGSHRVQYDLNNLLFFANRPLKINSSGFYQYDTGTNTLFYRKINIEYIDNNQLKVTSEVTWRQQGIDNSVGAETRLYNWLEAPEE